ncbi:MAG TPA: insulinase family protein [Vicinamibacterales bacterium]|nr:insulinase family protein [Vicinamibacterales bacterium]
MLTRISLPILVAAACVQLVTPALATPAERPRVAQVPAPTSKPGFTPADPLPFDTAVTKGTLQNGLTYYIRRNPKPEKRVMLQLAVKAGSVDETDLQQGLAHFLEHMAFNGSRNFKPGELIKTLESTGARMGPHVNAYTSFDETVYMFQVPTDKAGIVQQGLRALADVAGGLTLDPKEINKERGVVIEEWRGGLGAAVRIRDQQIPILFYQSKYAERLPIGKPDVLKSFTPAQLRAFYTKWYRPDRMAVVVVGDIDAAEMQAQVKRVFGPLRKPSTPAPPRAYGIPLQPEMLIKVASDTEATQSSISIVRKRKSAADDTVADYRRNLTEQLVSQMLNERFDELSRKKDAQFLGASAYESPLNASVSLFSLGAAVEEGKLAQGLAALQIESSRVKQFGFGPSELERAKKWWLASYERAYNERDKSESSSFAQEYISHFLTGEPTPGIAYEFRLAQAIIPSISASEVAGAATRLFADGSRAILGVSPQKQGLTLPTEAELRDAITKADRVSVTAWKDAASGKALMDGRPEPGAIKDRREIAEIGVTVVRFGNGVEAWLKPTDYKNDQVLFSLVAPGGASLAPSDKYLDAVLSPALVQLSGIGGHTAVDLQKLLAGKIATARASMTLSAHAISGSANPANLETGLQLLHLNFTSPGNDDEAFGVIRKQLDASYANRDQNPALLFGEKVAQLNTGDHYTAQAITLERLAKLDRNAMAAFYRDRFSNAADFTFLMVGAFKTNDVLPLLQRYVGSLPSTGEATSKAKDVGFRFPAANANATVAKGREPKVTTQIAFFADPPQDSNELTRISAATDVLEIALRDILREELGETYTVGVGLEQEMFQRGGGHIAVSFTAAPENLQKMTARVMQEIQRMQKAGPTEDLTNRAKESARREHETGMKTNGYWLSRLQGARMLGINPVSHVLEREKRIDAVTSQQIKEVFVKYFPMDRYTVVTLLPGPK